MLARERHSQTCEKLWFLLSFLYSWYSYTGTWTRPLLILRVRENIIVLARWSPRRNSEQQHAHTRGRHAVLLDATQPSRAPKYRTSYPNQACRVRNSNKIVAYLLALHFVFPSKKQKLRRYNTKYYIPPPPVHSRLSLTAPIPRPAAARTAPATRTTNTGLRRAPLNACFLSSLRDTARASLRAAAAPGSSSLSRRALALASKLSMV